MHFSLLLYVLHVPMTSSSSNNHWH